MWGHCEHFLGSHPSGCLTRPAWQSCTAVRFALDGANMKLIAPNIVTHAIGPPWACMRFLQAAVDRLKPIGKR